MDDEILKLSESLNANQSKENTPKYTKEVEKYATAFFKGNVTKLELLKYLSENFNSTNGRVTDLTKYNHIYRFFSDIDSVNLEKKAYQNLIKELLGFDYANRDVKGETQKHLEQLENLSSLFYKNNSK